MFRPTRDVETDVGDGGRVIWRPREDLTYNKKGRMCSRDGQVPTPELSGVPTVRHRVKLSSPIDSRSETQA